LLSFLTGYYVFDKINAIRYVMSNCIMRRNK
jgi:hypothetical protein